MSASHNRALEALARRGRLRTLEPQQGLDFASNDYLGLAQSDALRAVTAAALERGVAIGSGGSRLLRGNHPEHELLEAEAAHFFGAEAALFFAGGFAANSAVLATLPQRGDLIVHDALIHASAHDGMRLSKAERLSSAHNDCDAVNATITTWRQAGGVGQVWIAVESLYSMEGSRAPVDELMRLADTHDAMLVIDEAHATGVFGNNGRGLAEHLEGRENVVTLHTCGKALGVMGGLVLSSRRIRDFLINRARGFIYATAPSPLIAATVRGAIHIAANADDKRRGVYERIDAVAAALAKHAPHHSASGSQIQPIMLGTDSKAVAVANALRQNGYDVRAIRPPTVPEGASRLRVSLTLNTTTGDVDALIAAVAAAEAEAAS